MLTPELVILGGGWAIAGELIIEPIKAEMRRRVITTPVERVDVVLAELGTWAGAIGAAVHGAERAAAGPGGRRRGRGAEGRRVATGGMTRPYAPRYREIESRCAPASPPCGPDSACRPTSTSAPSSGSAA